MVQSSLERVWRDQYNGSGRNRIKDYISIAELKEEDLRYIQDDIIIEIINFNGQKVFSKIANNFNGFSFSIILNAYSKGIYFIQFRGSKNIETHKLIIE